MAARKAAAPKDAAASSSSTPTAGVAPAKGEDFTEVLNRARAQFMEAADAEFDFRSAARDDKRFRASEQWPVNIQQERIRDKRPMLTINRLPQFIKQITNQIRQNRPSIQISPVDDMADPDTADILQGIIRHIENTSHAQVAYDSAVEDQVTCGRGYIRLLTEYETDDLRAGAAAFQQGIRIRRVPDPEKVYMDPNCIEPDYSDAMFGFEFEDLSPETFRKKYPGAKVVSLEEFNSIGDDDRKHWLPDGRIRVANYFCVEFEDVHLALLSDGTVMEKAEAERAVAGSQAQRGTLALVTPVGATPQQAPLTILDERQAQKRVVKQYLMTGAEILKQGEWAGKWIPIIPVLGDEVRLDGKVDYRGIVRDSKDQQRLYNYQVTAMVEVVALAPKAPYIIAEGQVEPYKKMWGEANTRNRAYLTYKPQSVNGTLAPPPQRQNFEPAIQAIVATVQQADNDLKATTGFFDASLGERGPEQSGKAILARQKQGEIASSNYMDNLGRALWAIGRQLLDLIPKIYDAPRVMRITGLDDQVFPVLVHAGQAQAAQSLQQKAAARGLKGIEQIYDLGVGRYDVIVQVGPGQSTRRQEAVEMMTQAVQANPNLLQFIGDLYFGAMDWPMARQIAERLKKVLPPELQDEQDSEIPPAVKAKMAHLQQMAQALTQRVNELEDEKSAKLIEIKSKDRIEHMKAQIEILKLLAAQLGAAAADGRKADMAREGDARKAQMAKDGDDRKAAQAQASDERQAAATAQNTDQKALASTAETLLKGLLQQTQESIAEDDAFLEEQDARLAASSAAPTPPTGPPGAAA